MCCQNTHLLNNMKNPELEAVQASLENTFFFSSASTEILPTRARTEQNRIEKLLFHPPHFEICIWRQDFLQWAEGSLKITTNLLKCARIYCTVREEKGLVKKKNLLNVNLLAPEPAVRFFVSEFFRLLAPYQPKPPMKHGPHHFWC